MVWFGIFWLICLMIVLREVLCAPILQPTADDGDPDESEPRRPADRARAHLDHQDPQA